MKHYQVIRILYHIDSISLHSKKVKHNHYIAVRRNSGNRLYFLFDDVSAFLKVTAGYLYCPVHN